MGLEGRKAKKKKKSENLLECFRKVNGIIVNFESGTNIDFKISGKIIIIILVYFPLFSLDIEYNQSERKIEYCLFIRILY